VLKRFHAVLLALCLGLGAVFSSADLAAADAGSPWIAGPNAVGDDTFSGFIDAPAAGSTVPHLSAVIVRGWIVDRTALGWTGIDGVQIYRGSQDQGGTLLASASVGVRRDDVVAALGNPFWVGAGFNASFTDSGLSIGPNVLSVYAHTPDRGWWYKQVTVRIPAPPDRGFADDPLLIVREAVPSVDVDQAAPTLTLRGYAIDRNMPLNLSVGAFGSGVGSIQFYLDGPKTAGTFLGNAQQGLKNREATGFGERFLQSGWEINLHPGDFSVDKHALFIYAYSAYWPSETLEIMPFTVH
jgi:hypothetical protein